MKTALRANVTCAKCGKEFEAVVRMRRKYCSGVCSRAASRGVSRNKVHGRWGTSENNIWKAMRKRCFRVKDPAYPRYGGRGITCCERWNTFENFLADMGPRPPGKSLERRDNDKGYSPDNCYWATPLEQARNRSTVWTARELQILRDEAARGRYLPDLASLLGRTPAAVSGAASREGISIPRRPGGYHRSV